MKRLILAGVLSLLVVPVVARQEPALKDLVPKGMLIGSAINQRQSDGVDTAGDAIITRQFNVISPENLLKFASVHPQPDTFTFDAQDRYVAFGLDHGMQVIGHNLIWHSQTPAWVFAGKDGAPPDRETMLARMKTHIDTVVGRYKGRIHGWDVVNEALNEDGTMRDSPWHRAIGDDYVAKAFEFAHAADPNVELYYNDYNLATPAKRAGAIRLVKDLQARGLRVDGIGEQAHWKLATPTIPQIEDVIKDVHSLGIKIMFTELDIDMLPPAPPGARRGGPPPAPQAGNQPGAAPAPPVDPAEQARLQALANPYADGLPADKQQALAQRYADIFKLILAHKAEIARVNFWGVTDADSWLSRPTRLNYPLLWDRDHKPKPAFDAIVDVLKHGQ